MRFEDCENATEFLRDHLKIDKVKRIREYALTPDEFNYKFEPTTADLPEEIRFQCPILCAAIFYNAVKCFEFLVGGAKLTATDSWRAGAVHMAARMGRLDILKHPALQSLDFLASDFRGRTPAHYAASNGNLECLKFLMIEKGAKIESADKFGMTVLHVAFEAGRCEIVRYLTNGDLEITCDKLGRTPAGVAVEKGQVEVLRVCGEKMLSAVDGGRRNLMHLAAKSGFVEVIEELKSVPSIDANLLDSAGFAPIHYAAEYDHREVVMALLQIPGIDLRLQDARGNCAIHIAAAVGAVNALSVLISRNPDDNNVKNRRMRSPLFEAVANGQPGAVRELIRAGAVGDADQNGVTVHDVLKGSSAPEIIELLAGHVTAMGFVASERFYDIEDIEERRIPRARSCNIA
jgi:ankyrin repeat protein